MCWCLDQPPPPGSFSGGQEVKECLGGIVHDTLTKASPDNANTMRTLQLPHLSPRQKNLNSRATSAQ